MRLVIFLLGLVTAPHTTGERGISTWYSSRDDSDRTACGGYVRDGYLHAAFRDTPCGARLRVTSLQTGRAVVVVTDDFGGTTVEPDGSGPPDWRAVYANRVHGVWTPKEGFLRACRLEARATGHCSPPRGFRWRDDVDLSPAAWSHLGLHPRQGRAEVRIERVR